MKNEMTIFEHPMFGEVRVVMDVSNEPLFCLADLCNALALNPTDVKKRLEDGVVSIHPIFDNYGRKQMANFVNEDGMYDVVLDSRKKRAREMRKWVTSEVLPSIRKTGKYEVSNHAVKPSITKENVECRLLLIKGYEELLHINDASKAMMLNSIASELNAPLLDYVPSKGSMHSATYLLKKEGVDMSAQKFNKQMLEKGFLEVITRPSRSTKGGVKSFYSIADKGKEYGENQVSPNNPKETQPLWYDSKFKELLAMI